MSSLPWIGLCHHHAALDLRPMQSTSPCPDCGGEGTIIDHPCDMCDGQGRTPTHEKIDIEVPAGISSGRQLRVRGYGEAGFRGEASGDLLVTVVVKITNGSSARATICCALSRSRSPRRRSAAR